MSEHEERADELERELDDMEKQGDRLDGEIADTRSDWERKQADGSVPGAVDTREPEGPEPEPDGEAADEPPPEQQYPAKD